eukprot:12194316-Heterocapsa_arctica.AAC.1
MYVPPGVGPPWYDARTGGVLDEAMTVKGMEDEMKSVQNFDTYDEAAEDKVRAEGWAIIGTRWVLGKRGPPA